MSLNNYLETSLYLAVDDKTRHYVYFGAKRTARIHKADLSGGMVTKTVRIQNGRNNTNLKLDDAAFQLVDCPTNLSTADFYALQKGDHKLKNKYYEEVKECVKKHTGCDEVHVFSHQVRNESKINEEESNVQGYANMVPHTDSSPVSADEMAVQMLGIAESEPTDYKRYLYVNLWRNISDDQPIQNDHLAMLDERTVVKPDDYITKDLFGSGYSVVQFSLSARHVDQHKWYYFPHMTKTEGILFKQADSDYTKTGRICFHSSVHDDSIKDHPSRESIEVRMMCFWKKTDDPNEVNSMPTEDNINLSMIKDPMQVALELSNATFTLNPFVLIWRFLAYVFGSLSGTSGEVAPYTGSPKDYEDRFFNGIKYFRYWPKYAQTWAKGIMAGYETPEDGVKEVTKHLVDDATGYNKTKGFKKTEKNEIVEYLVNNERYMKAAKEALVGKS
mmetsp:Transcript_38244/g.92532  ORF Transcript_38244/g.92532 Transcript_38244/m.92532 type:complete len:445 (+) Transcript_38244:749-2083(+)|eukprot:CAMPEP_0113625068 /NCGR_PEP_ID=MMETSP0017_2-20120614/12942_1 /TAXON_ID=2856 /ORGANISM="Cylindrotheca closterium" /LENGTH=444 /DNA_ID=CAMNT_0000535157 /DNA_START=626 /DNA_END=1960 /DNA_ORIENTATION=+ /assembly_acc=CAM_ASM_000147